MSDRPEWVPDQPTNTEGVCKITRDGNTVSIAIFCHDRYKAMSFYGKLMDQLRTGLLQINIQAGPILHEDPDDGE